MQAVGLTESDILAFGLCASLGEHAFAQVKAGDLDAAYTVGKGEGYVAGTGGHIHNMARTAAAHDFHERTEPQAVEPEGHGAVHEVVGRSDGVEHRLYLFGFGAFVIVGVYVLYFQLNQLLRLARKSRTPVSIRASAPFSSAGTNFLPVRCS